MKARLIKWTEQPVSLCSSVAGTTYGVDDAKPKRLARCIKNGHLGVLEHAYVTFRISDVSRSCTHQLVRHRLASFVQKSQRYTKLRAEMQDWFVVPDSIEERGFLERYVEHCEYALDLYLDMLAVGVPAEDARFALPEATKTEICMTMNWREFFHFLDLRLDPNAQWEIRQLASLMMAECNICEDMEVAKMMEYYREVYTGVER